MSLAACLTVSPGMEEVMAATRGTSKRSISKAEYHKMQAAFLKGYEWDQNATIKIGFLQQTYTDDSGQNIDPNYSTYRANFVKTVVDNHIAPLVNLRFKWGVDPSEADVRISFTKGPNGSPGPSYSYIGAQSTDTRIPKDNPTMNLGWLDDDQDYDSPDYAGTGIVILHEFGHMLGMIHEHSRADSNLQWNKPLIYKALGGPPNNWSHQTVDEQVFDTVPVDSFNGSVYDKTSVMHYIFPESWFLVDPHLPEVTQLSPLDVKWISKTYPSSTGVRMGGVMQHRQTKMNLVPVGAAITLAVLIYLMVRKV